VFMEKKKKVKTPYRVPVAPPSKVHKSQKSYDRRRDKKETERTRYEEAKNILDAKAYSTAVV
jgi:hypothetical protein